ncbi:MAG: TraR/DksA family transcriptional regulator [Phycisphaerales bacterium]|nr:TraR/DksA family transcriptional regulator [Phycisphaerales bacterium]
MKPGSTKPETKPETKSEPKTESTGKLAKSNGKASKEAPKAPVKPAAPEAKAAEPAGKSGRKGITIVTPKPAKKARPKSSGSAVPALSGSVFGMGFGSGKPLIPSGPAVNRAADADGDGQTDGKKPKSPFNKKQLDQFRDILIAKRRELLGDIDSMENEALKGESGSLSNLPQHMAEQGSETYEQSLSLDLAAADRVLLREIDAALGRIADKTYGLCEHTGKPISKERLAELPWARYSIEAAREMERRAR